MHSPTAVSVSISEPKAELTLDALLSVVALVPGGAAERAGVHIGDTLIAVGGAAQQQGNAGMAAALNAIKTTPRPVSLLFARGRGGGGAQQPMQFAQTVLRMFAWFMLGISIFNFISGGLAIISSALVIAQAACVLNLTRSSDTLVLAVSTMSLFGGGVDCGNLCNSVTSLRALSITGMVFAIIELLIFFPVTEFFGLITRGSADGIVGTVSFWLLYAAGNTFVTAVLHLGLSVTMFELANLLISSSQQRIFMDGGDRQMLVGSSFGDAYLAMDGSNGGSKHAALLPPPAVTLRAYSTAAAYAAADNDERSGQ
jgi:hypothetical protein